jgi:hypothetical protein
MAVTFEDFVRAECSRVLAGFSVQTYSAAMLAFDRPSEQRSREVARDDEKMSSP